MAGAKANTSQMAATAEPTCAVFSRISNWVIWRVGLRAGERLYASGVIQECTRELGTTTGKE
jgi:hypothetical protein